MRPVALAIEGLTSFRQQQEVDLNGLDLFVITGPTGSGKSSVLDAITFALYGKVCRVDGRGELKHVITHNSPAMKVQLDFEVQGETYRIVRRTPRRGPTAASLERFIDGEPVVETPGVRAIDRRIEELLGLDFDAFTKAVLLPQGRFHEFLSGDAGARRKILSGLLELDRYATMGSVARERAKMLGLRLDERQRRLDEDYADATPQRLEGVRVEAAESEAGTKLLREACDRARILAEDARVAAERVVLLDRVTAPLDTIANDVRTLRTHAEDLTRLSAGALEALQQAEKTLSEAEDSLDLAERGLELAIGRFGDEVRLTGFLHAAGEISRETEALNRVVEEQKGVEVEMVAAGVLLEQARTVKGEADSAMQQTLDAGERLRAEFDVAERLVKHATLKLRLEEADLGIVQTNDALAEAVHAREEAQKGVDHVNSRHLAVSLKGQLTKGDACPVCEQIVIALPKQQDDLVQLVRRARQALEEAEKRHGETQGRAAQARAERSSLNRDLEEVLSSLGEAAELLSKPDADKRLDKTKAELAKAREEYTAGFKRQQALENDLRVADATVVRLTERKDNLDGTRKDLTRRIDEATAILDSAFSDRIPEDAGAHLESQLATVRDQRHTFDERKIGCEAARTDLQSARHRLDETTNGRHQILTHLAQFRGTLRNMAGSLEQIHNFSETLLLADPEDEETAEGLASRLEEFCSRLAQVGQRLRDRFLETVEASRLTITGLARERGLCLNGDVVPELFEQMGGALRESESRNQRLTAAVQELEKRVNRRKAIEEFMVAGRKQLNLYQRLARELQSDRFIAHVLRESMTTLAALATTELKKITGGRYGIEPNESGFEVIDHENADERRSVATLSGGETFLASLALALALSGSVRDLAGNAAAARLDSMFIDEGFGALDPETLGVAADALERLAGDSRMIGVISHVPELAERFPDGLDIRKVGVSSTITRR